MGEEYEQAVYRKKKANVLDKTHAEHRICTLMVQMMAIK